MTGLVAAMSAIAEVCTTQQNAVVLPVTLAHHHGHYSFADAMGACIAGLGGRIK
jgi:hypothetical protein